MHKTKYNELRKKVTALLKTGNQALLKEDCNNIEHLLDELHVQYTELEAQNTELKELKNKLEKEQEKFKELYLEAPVAYFTIDKNGNITQLNKAAANLIGLPVDAFDQTSIFPHLHEASGEEFFAFINSVFQSDTIQYSEIVFKNNKAEHIPTRLQAQTYFCAEKNQKLCRCAVSDLTHLKAYKKLQEREKQLIESEQQYKILFYDSQTINLLIDPDSGRIIDANTKACEYYGIPYHQLLTKNIKEINTLSPDQVQKEMQRAKDQSRGYFLFKHRLQSGEIRHVEVYSKPMNLRDNTVLHSVIFDIEEKYQAEQQVFKLSTAVIQSPVTIIITNLQGNIEYVNPKFTETTGYTAEQVIGKNPKFLKSGYTTTGEYQKLWETITSGKIWHGDFLNKHKNGTLFWESVTIAPIRNKNNDIINFVAIKEDISERKRVEEELSDLNAELTTTIEELNVSNEKLNAINEKLNATNATIASEREQFLSLLDSIPELIYVSDKETSEVLFTNMAFKELLGRDITGEKCYEAIQGKKHACNFCTNSIIFNQERPHYWEYYNPLLNKHFYIMDRAIKWYDGRVVRFELAINITRIKKIENELRKSKQEFETIFENANIGTCLVGTDGKFLKVNQQMVNIYGYSKKELLQLNVNDITIREDRDISPRYIKNALNGKSEQAFFEKRYRHKNGRIIHCLVSSTIIKDADHTYFISHINDITKQKQTEAALKASEAKYRFMYENINDLICLHSPTGEYKEVSPSVEKILGYKPKELIGKNPYDLFHPDDIERIRTESHEKALKGKPVKIQYRIRKNDGTYIWFETITEIITENDTVVHLMTSSRDVTQTVNYVNRINKVNKALQDIQQSLVFATHGDFNHKMVQSIANILKADITFIGEFTNSTQKTIRTINLLMDNKFVENIEYDLKHTPCERVINADACFFPKGIQALFPEDKMLQDLNIEGYIGLPLLNSENYTIGIVVALYRQPIDEPEFYQYILQIFSSRIAAEMERTKTEQELKLSEKKYRLIAENATDVIWIINAQTQRFTYISPSVYNLRGYTVEEAMKQDLNESLTPESAEIVKKLLVKRLKEFLKNNNAEQIYTDQLQQPCKDGSIIWIETTTRYHLNSDNEVEILGISRNIDQRKKMEFEILNKNSQLEELNATKDKFFSIIAHDLRSPFNTILGMSQLLSDNYSSFTDERKLRLIASIKRSANSTFKLLENLLTWSRTQSGKIQYIPEKINMYELIFDVVSVLEDVYRKKNIRMTININKKIYATADRNTIDTVIRNLVSNAIKFTPREGTIAISAYFTKQKKKQFVETCVADTGVGMSPEQKVKLFKIDKNTSTPGTENERGTGLGLILCKEFVEKNHGKIRVESKEGEGSKFYFTLPVAKNVETNQQNSIKNTYGEDYIESTKQTMKKHGESLLTFLNTELLPVYYSAKKNNSYSALNTLINTLFETGKKFKIDQFIHLSKAMKTQMKDFKINELQDFIILLDRILEKD